MFTVYAIYNKKHKKVYIGQTQDIQERLALHNSGAFPKSYTARFDGEWALIYSEEADDRTLALFREKRLKSHKGRDWLKQYIPR